MSLISSKENKLSFGIELEFIITFKQVRKTPPTSTTTVSEEEEVVLPPALECPRIQDGGADWFIDYENLAWCADEIVKIIRKIPGASVKVDNSKPIKGKPDLYPSIYASPDECWVVKEDVSVSDSHVHEPPGYSTQGVEVISPAMWDCPEAHRHIQDVVTALTHTLRWRVNLKSGFHVHVGAGKSKVVDGKGKAEWKSLKHDFHVLQRAAALIWAADHFLCYAHPPERQLNTYARPITMASSLAVGQEHLMVRVSLEEGDPWEWDGKGKPVYISNQIADRFPNLTIPPRPPKAGEPPSTLLRPELLGKSHRPLFPAMRPSRVERSAHDRIRPYFGLDWDVKEDRLKAAEMTMERGIAYIMRPESRHKIAALMNHMDRNCYRLNYNFCQYHEMDGKGYYTIEFREAAGTLDPTTIAAWSNICLAIFRFSKAASDAAFWTTIWNLIDAHNAARAGQPHNYDMISLMTDMGAASEASFLERSLGELGARHWYPSVQCNRERGNSVRYSSSVSSSSAPSPVWGPQAAGDDKLDYEQPSDSDTDSNPQSQQPQQQQDSHESQTGWRPPRPTGSASQSTTDPLVSAINGTGEAYKSRREELRARADQFDEAWERLQLGRRRPNIPRPDISTNF
ncbi:hypothetical protein B0T21DRAFT_385214 [Apiosordaria backusii]|uniref:Uncharacterized protein n=1 Tax=Apiosordaria backusii TaxID=314023 RepID=A0AA40B7I4_9PEZI|nr:hypothetical protein B0T21DRAFT_385214 [Apiosordaria backusii]